MKKYHALFAIIVLLLSMTMVNSRAQAQGTTDLRGSDLRAVAFAYDETMMANGELVLGAVDPMAGSLTGGSGLAAPDDAGNPMPWFLIGTGLILLVSAGVLIARYQ